MRNKDRLAAISIQYSADLAWLRDEISDEEHEAICGPLSELLMQESQREISEISNDERLAALAAALRADAKWLRGELSNEEHEAICKELSKNSRSIQRRILVKDGLLAPKVSGSDR